MALFILSFDNSKNMGYGYGVVAYGLTDLEASSAFPFAFYFPSYFPYCTKLHLDGHHE